MAEINVVPYIDVMLVLLIIFMVTAPMLMQGVKVELPQAQTEPVDNQDSEPVIVSINAQGSCFSILVPRKTRCCPWRRSAARRRGDPTQPGQAGAGVG
jgi:biopolymer transport protein ExbD